MLEFLITVFAITAVQKVTATLTNTPVSWGVAIALWVLVITEKATREGRKTRTK
jgi:hypothetical protein